MIRCLATLVLSFAVAFASILLPEFTVQDNALHNFEVEIKVPVELGVMSRCPDALLCEDIFDHVLQWVPGKVDLTLRYVAKLDASEPIFGVKCPHGVQECAGNVQQLCVAKYAPSHWWEFVRCQNFEGKEKVGDPALAVKCAGVVNIDWNESEIGECAGRDGSGHGAEGIRMLQESVVVTAMADITKSCTVLIEGQKVCVHDGAWKECENGHSVPAFVRQINHAYRVLNS